MYGTVAYLKAKPGKAEELMALQNEIPDRKPAGMVALHIYRLDSNPNEFIMAVMFKDKASYVANAGAPEQDKEFRRMRELLDADPRWADGEVVQSIT
jgi:quinol monooxygenase YgiN